MSFALTKIQPPRRSAGTIGRPLLERRLDAAMATHKLVLLSAPAGFGKTAALTRQIARMPQGSALAWISCDEDDDLQRLLSCMVAALEPFDLPWRSDPDTLATRSAGARSQRRAVADELLNALAACDATRRAIVFDDVQRIEDPSVFEFLDMLLAGLPPNWVLVLAGREPPPLSLARLRVQDELAEFRESDLQFNAEEVEALLQATPGAAARVGADQLLERTQGWAVGLRLALNSATTVRGDQPALRSAALDRHVFDYLAAEVLDLVPPELRVFLLRCSVLPELSAARCQQVSGDARAGHWLEEIDKRGLFVSALEGTGLTLRLHDLFRDFLEDRLRREHAEELPELLRRAAAGEVDTIRRIGYLLRAGATDEACRDLCAAGPDLMARGVVAPVQRLIDQFPQAQRDEPQLQLLRGQCAWALWDFDTFCQATHQAATGFLQAGDVAGRQRAQAYEAIALNGAYRHVEAAQILPGLLAQPLDDDVLACALHASVWHAVDVGPLVEVAVRFERELDVVERLDTPLLWYLASPVARYLGLPGIVPQLMRFAEGALRRVGPGASPPRVMAVTVMACLQVWAGRPDEAEALLHTAEEDMRWLGQARTLSTQTQMCRALLHALRGEATPALAAARDYFNLVEDEPEGPRRHTMLNVFLLQEARLAALLGDSLRLRQLAQELGRVPQLDFDGPAMAQRAVLPAYLADADGRREQAIALRRAALQREGQLSRLGLGIETRLRLAAGVLQQEGPAAAAECVLPALLATDDATEIAPVLMAGPAVLAELAAAHWASHLDAAARHRLRRWADLAQRLRSASRPLPAAPPGDFGDQPGGLSAREAEVLARIAAGDSNKLIARTFNLSPHTVKRHVANILDKLGAQTRGQAAAWLRARP